MIMKIMLKRVVNAFYLIGQSSIHYSLVKN